MEKLPAICNFFPKIATIKILLRISRAHKVNSSCHQISIYSHTYIRVIIMILRKPIKTGSRVVVINLFVHTRKCFIPFLIISTGLSERYFITLYGISFLICTKVCALKYPHMHFICMIMHHKLCFQVFFVLLFFSLSFISYVQILIHFAATRRATNGRRTADINIYVGIFFFLLQLQLNICAIFCFVVFYIY